jgi:hypothetical protein
MSQPGGRELHVDVSGPKVEAWYHRPGAVPLRVAVCNTVDEAKAALVGLAAEIRHKNTLTGE